jgi:hypothetical protein
VIGPRPSATHRWRRALSFVGTFLVVGLLLLAVSVPVSATRLVLGSGPRLSWVGTSPSAGTVDVSWEISNGGIYTLGPLRFAVVVLEPPAAILGRGSSPPQTIAPGASETLTLTVPVSWTPSSSSSFSVLYWVNGTYAEIFPFTLGGIMKGPQGGTSPPAAGGLSSPVISRSGVYARSDLSLPGALPRSHRSGLRVVLSDQDSQEGSREGSPMIRPPAAGALAALSDSSGALRADRSCIPHRPGTGSS